MSDPIGASTPGATILRFPGAAARRDLPGPRADDIAEMRAAAARVASCTDDRPFPAQAVTGRLRIAAAIMLITLTLVTGLGTLLGVLGLTLAHHLALPGLSAASHTLIVLLTPACVAGGLVHLGLRMS